MKKKGTLSTGEIIIILLIAAAVGVLILRFAYKTTAGSQAIYNPIQSNLLRQHCKVSNSLGGGIDLDGDKYPDTCDKCLGVRGECTSTDNSCHDDNDRDTDGIPDGCDFNIQKQPDKGKITCGYLEGGTRKDGFQLVIAGEKLPQCCTKSYKEFLDGDDKSEIKCVLVKNTA
tara:strand:+ start:1969 stop:2484 length:516 start_codon:yes stop_codon:yes gene_type:complete